MLPDRGRRTRSWPERSARGSGLGPEARSLIESLLGEPIRTPLKPADPTATRWRAAVDRQPERDGRGCSESPPVSCLDHGSHPAIRTGASPPRSSLLSGQCPGTRWVALWLRAVQPLRTESFPFRLTHPGVRSWLRPFVLGSEGHPAWTNVFRVEFQTQGGGRPRRTALTGRRAS